MNLKNYKALSSLHGVSGHELEIRKYMKNNLSNADEVVQDKLGGVFGIYKGNNNPVIMITAHMDEIGGMVKEITKDGFIKMISIGTINPEAFVSSCCYVTTKENTRIKGVISSIPPHISKDNKLEFDELLLDIGAESLEHAKKLGVEIGDFITPIDNFFITADKKKMVNKGFDDRLGCAIVLDLASEIKNIDHPNTIILGGTVQEEVGLRGAAVSSNMLTPDLFITIDVSPTSDYLGKPEEGRLGGGFLIRYYDPVTIMQPTLLKYFSELAIKSKIPYQLFKSKGGTDAGAAQLASSGCFATTVGIPGRYIHSPYTMVSLEDINSAIKFLTKLIKTFDKTELEKLRSL